MVYTQLFQGMHLNRRETCRGVGVAAGLGQVPLSDHSKLQGKGLQKHGSKIGEQDHNEQLVAESGTSLQVSGPAHRQ